jgi:hypothetical protein
MGKTHSIELRERVVAFVDEGNSHRDAARHFRVSPKFVNDMVKLRRETGALLAKPQGNLGRTGKLRPMSQPPSNPIFHESASQARPFAFAKGDIGHGFRRATGHSVY